MKIFVRFISVVSLLVAFAASANAADTVSIERRLRNLEKELTTLKKEQKTYVKSTKTNEFLSKLQFNGRLHIDGKFYDEQKYYETERARDHKDDGVEIKRARFSVYSSIGEKSNFMFEENFNNDAASVAQAWFNYEFAKNWDVKAGQVIAPFAIERYKSSNVMTTINYSNSLINTAIPYYLTGLSVWGAGEKVGFHGGFFGDGTSSDGSRVDDSTYVTSGRLFYAPVRNEDLVVHLGVGAAYNDKDRDISENADTGVRTHSTIEDITAYGAELGLNYKAWNLQVEANKVLYDYAAGTNSGADAWYHSAYAQTSFFLTGESRSYSMYGGTFGGIKIKNPVNKGGKGAFELVTRYSYSDSSDYTRGVSVDDGRKDEYLVGLNWYPRTNFRFMFDYSKNYLNYQDDANAVNDQEYDLYVFRTQLNF